MSKHAGCNFCSGICRLAWEGDQPLTQLHHLKQVCVCGHVTHSAIKARGWPCQVHTAGHDEGAARIRRAVCGRSGQGDVWGVSGPARASHCCVGRKWSVYMLCVHKLGITMNGLCMITFLFTVPFYLKASSWSTNINCVWYSNSPFTINSMAFTLLGNFKRPTQ